MKIIALDGASGTGKSTLINRLNMYFNGEEYHTNDGIAQNGQFNVLGGLRRGQVSCKQLIYSSLDEKLDQFIREGKCVNEQKQQYCNELIDVYTKGIIDLQKQDREFRKQYGCERIFILDRYLLSLYAIQGVCWQIPRLFEICQNLPKPDRQYIIQMKDRYNEEDQSFISARDEWINHGLETGNCRVITNIISGIDVVPQNYNNDGFEMIVECIMSYLQRIGIYM